MSPTYGSFFSGGGLADIGAKAAGYTLTFANEIDPQIAAVYRENLGDHIIVGDVLNLDIDALPYVDLFHASPVCTRASIANKNRGESALDIATAQKTADYIRAKLPAKVTIENVSQYRDFKAYRILIDTLDACGYWHNAEILNSADFGVPQTRRRLVVRAVRGGFVPYLPAPVKWVGWYEAIADLIPTLPSDKFADWQIARLPENIRSFLINDNRTSLDWASEKDIIAANQPSATISAQNHSVRGFVINGDNAGRDLTILEQSDPLFTVISENNKTPIRGFIPNRAAYVVCGTPNDNGESVTTRDEREPIFTVTSSVEKRPNRAWLSSGCVVRMTPRALARFQSVPDWYKLPESNKLAGRIIGNGVPSLMYQRIAESLL